MRTTIEQKTKQQQQILVFVRKKQNSVCVCAYKNECGRRRFLSHKKEGPAVGRKINQEWWTDLSRVIDDSRRVPLLWLDSTHDTSTTSFSLFFFCVCDYLSRFFLVWFSFDFVDEQYFACPYLTELLLLRLLSSIANVFQRGGWPELSQIVCLARPFIGSDKLNRQMRGLQSSPLQHPNKTTFK